MPLNLVRLRLILVLKDFSRSRKIVAERDLYSLIKAVIGTAVYFNVAIALIGRHTTTQSTGSGHRIYTHKHECSQKIHTTIPT